LKVVDLNDEAAVREEAQIEFNNRLMASHRATLELEDSKRRARHGGQLVYRRDSEHSFFIDMCKREMRNAGDARARLTDHGSQVNYHPEFRTGLSTTGGHGGDFAPPAYVQSAFTAAAHPLRVTANVCKPQPLPRNAPTFIVPAFTSGAGVGVASTQNQALSETDPADTSIISTTTPVASKMVVSRQLWDQASPDSRVDDVIAAEIGEGSGAELDALVLNGTGSGQMTGLLNVSGVGTVAADGSAPTPAAALAEGVAAGVQAVFSNRWRMPDVIVMHPRRWLAAFGGTVDSQNRPLLLPSTHPAALIGTPGNNGVVAEWLTARVLLDVNMPVTSGDGSQDYVIVGYSNDWLLYESEPTFQAYHETLAAQMSVTLLGLEYAGLAVKYPSSICLVGPFDAPS
jgi:HK97 family phage major capsid protein